MRCVCCDRILLAGEMAKRLPDGSWNDMCNICVDAALRPKDWHEYQLQHLTEDPFFGKFDMNFTRYSE